MNAPEAHHCDYQDEDYEVEFNIDLEPHLSDLLPHPDSSSYRKNKHAALADDQPHRTAAATAGYADEDYEMEFQVNLEPSVMDLVPHNGEEVRDNLTISVAFLAVAGAMVTARKLGKK
mmetsp:Transcript_2943/g.4784  ORF Transcript_2943/g.4784 Transcript_2943/m.4784 type:complete len:118 (-) Transcript_2943:131-484(-)|eukprot:CAMPEP_0119006844 /NCGR_PEP_ID=MMETSP1176-20130426/2582_1 /TAXON_ID=265551 /ORGANISM="Synedropsis recta cf, Strain CCMP1620" /LENGTH=117 /DNA_ID=CAMNT_0006958853 /DNA_START=175 /DNA_END=528 /DNA_ORIENTATION=-